MMKQLFIMLSLLVAGVCKAQNLQLNDKEYFERQGVLVTVSMVDSTMRRILA